MAGWRLAIHDIKEDFRNPNSNWVIFHTIEHEGKNNGLGGMFDWQEKA